MFSELVAVVPVEIEGEAIQPVYNSTIKQMRICFMSLLLPSSQQDFCAIV
jgi:hypothetical protein